MTATMGPPPPRRPATATSDEASISESSTTAAMAPPPPRDPPQPSKSDQESIPPDTDACPAPLQNPSSSPPEIVSNQELSSAQTDSSEVVVEKRREQQSDTAAVVPYTIPDWSGPPCHNFSLEVLKQGAIIDQIDVNEKGAYMFGRVDLCDFVLEHPTISRFHAVLQFKSNGDAFLYDLGSTHGTFVNKKEVKKRVYVDLHVGDVIRFGHSSRLYVFQGPSDLMPAEGDLKRLKTAKFRQEMQDMEASLLRAKLEASRADGISWGMGEDAVEENEDEVDEITWQNYKGQLTEKQEKTREKVIKRLEKVAHMKKEIDAIRVKDIAQGGLTQGQQTQIARNEQRISQIMEELENLEETLNESIQESLGARAGRVSGGKKKGAMDEDEDDFLSDDDEFYDRTQKSTKNKSSEIPSVETADTLLDKKDALTKQMEEKQKLLMEEDKLAKTDEVIEAGDALDAYMSAVSSQLVLDNKEKVRNELSTLQKELDRILYLLRIADPTGEAARKRESEGWKPKEIVKEIPASDSGDRPSAEKNKNFTTAEKNKKVATVNTAEKNKKVAATAEMNEKIAPAAQKDQNSVPSAENGNFGPEDTPVAAIQKKAVSTSEPGEKRVEPASVSDMTQSVPTVYTVAKPQWLGAVEDSKKQEIAQEASVDMPETDQFIDYKDRGRILKTSDTSHGEPGLEEAAPGLIIRKRKQVETPKDAERKDTEQSTGFKAEDAVALLLKYSRGIHASDEEDTPISEDVKGKKEGKRPKRVLGPERPSLSEETDYSTWVPPKGQSGDGRTSLNDRLGY